MRYSGKEAIRIRWEVNTSKLRLQIEKGTDKRGILMREAIVLLSSPGRGLQVVDRANVMAPFSFTSLTNGSCLKLCIQQIHCTDHLHKLAVLHHHGVNDAYEGFVRREKSCPSCKCISLQHTLTSVLGQNFDDAPSLSTASNVPLEVSTGDFEYGVELVRNQLVRGENPKSGWIASNGY